MIFSFLKKYTQMLSNIFITNIDIFIIIFLILLTLLVITYKKYEMQSKNKNIKELHNY